MGYKNGIEFLNKLYTNMHMDDAVMHTAEKNDTPVEKISKYLNRLERVHNQAKSNESKMDILKSFYYEKYVIKELPESYIELQKKIAREEGYGNIEVTDDMRKRLLDNVQNDQKKSLDSWIEYLSSDDAMYPMWFKNYAFQGMLKLSSFDKEKREFGKRTSKTTNSYIELNREVLAQVYNTLANEVENNSLTDEQVQALENGISFKKLYTYYLIKYENNINNEKKSNEGIWIKYEQGSDSTKLCDTLQGKNTGWCTAGYDTAKMQLDMGDFYVYYTKDRNGEYTDPRIAIRMNEYNEIEEVRGIDKDQNLENEMIDIAEKKLDEFADKEKYKKKVHDMKLLAEIERKNSAGIDLETEEIMFLYEVHDEIEGFGWHKDPRISEIIKTRNNIADYNIIFNSTNTGMLYIDYLTSVDGLVIPEGSKVRALFRNMLITIDGLKIPADFNGVLNFTNLIEVEGLIIPKKFNGNVILSFGKYDFVDYERNDDCGELLFKFDDITTVENLKIPEKFRGNLVFNYLNIVKGLKIPDNFNGNLTFNYLNTAAGLTISDNFNGNLTFNYLDTAAGLTISDNFNGNLTFNHLDTADGLKIPDNFNGNLTFNKIRKIAGLTIPESFGGSLIFGGSLTFDGLNNFSELEIPENFSGNLTFNKLDVYSDIVIPKNFSGNLTFNELNIYADLVIPKSFSGSLTFDGLNNFSKLEIPDNFSGNITFNKLDVHSDIVIPENFSGNLTFNEANINADLVIPESFSGSLTFDKLNIPGYLDIPEKFSGNIIFNQLTTAKDINIPENFSGNLSFYGLDSVDDLMIPGKLNGNIYLELDENSEIKLPKSCKGKVNTAAKIEYIPNSKYYGGVLYNKYFSDMFEQEDTDDISEKIVLTPFGKKFDVSITKKFLELSYFIGKDISSKKGYIGKSSHKHH